MREANILPERAVKLPDVTRSHNIWSGSVFHDSLAHRYNGYETPVGMNIDFQDCLVSYQNHGIRFSYPDIWELQEQNDQEDVVITVSANATCFWLLRLLPSCPPPPQVVDSCIDAFQEEYDDVEVATADDTLADMPAYGRDIDFFCMELMNSTGLRSVRTSDFTLLVWWQGTHHELEEFRPIIDHMTRSVQVGDFVDGT